MKNQSKSKILFFTLTLIVIFMGCKKEESNKSNGGSTGEINLFDDKYDVYITGFEEVDGSSQVVLWKNGVKVPLNIEGLVSSGGEHVFVEGEDVYVAGKSYNGVDNKMTYWKNGEPHFLETPKVISMYSMSVNNGKVYMVGEAYNDNGILNAVYYTDEGVVSLGDTSIETAATSIFIENDDIYIAGYEAKNPSNLLRHGVYWKNEVQVEFSHPSDHSQPKGIFVKDGDVYIVGDYYSKRNSIIQTCAIWVNDSIAYHSFVSLYLSRIFVDGGNIYTADGSTAAYWKNDQKIELPINKNAVLGSAWSIFAVDNEVFVAGVENHGTGYMDRSKMQAKFWRNNKGMLLDANTRGYAKSIYVVKK